MAIDDDFAGGASNYYNPAFGLMAIQQPDMFVQHLAQRGMAPPADFPENFSHKDAHAILKDQSRAPGMGEAAGLPQQGSFDERFSDALRGAPGSMKSYIDTETGVDSNAPPASIPNPSYEAPNRTQDNRPSWFPKVGPTEQDPASRFGRWLRGEEPVKNSGASMPLPATSDIPFENRPAVAPSKPLTSNKGSEPWGGRPHVEPEPTAPADTASTAGGATVAAGSSREQVGDLNKEEPTAKTEVNAQGKKDKEGTYDGFGRALAGLTAMKPPTPVFPHPGPVPHPGSQIARSTVPTEILKELATIGRPAEMLRLGAALKGR